MPKRPPRVVGDSGFSTFPSGSCPILAKPEIRFISMHSSLPYKIVAVASTFSPRFKQVLAEAKRIRDRFDAELRAIYVGEQTEETSQTFREAFAQLQLPIDSTIYYEGGGEPAEAILRALAREKIGLVVAGALEKEVVLHQFLGN